MAATGGAGPPSPDHLLDGSRLSYQAKFGATVGASWRGQSLPLDRSVGYQHQPQDNDCADDNQGVPDIHPGPLL